MEEDLDASLGPACLEDGLQGHPRADQEILLGEQTVCSWANLKNTGAS